MNEIQEHSVRCPYCDKTITILVDGSVPEQTYVEDCQVCCRPILLDVRVGQNGDAEISANAENE